MDLRFPHTHIPTYSHTVLAAMFILHPLIVLQCRIHNPLTARVARSLSRAYARIKAANIQQIKTVSPVALPADLASKIRLSADFITDPAFASTMLTRQDERAFDTYLALRRYRAEGDVAAGGPAGGALFELDYARLAGDLGLDGSVTAYRRQIIRVLRKLQDEYGLLEVTFRHGKPAMGMCAPTYTQSYQRRAPAKPRSSGEGATPLPFGVFRRICG